MRIIEKALVILALAGIVLMFSLIVKGEIVFALAMASLSAFYFFFSFGLFNGIRLREIFKKEAYSGIPSLQITGAILTGFVMAHTAISIIFGLLRWHGYRGFLIVSIVSCVIILVISLIKMAGKYKSFYKRILTRICLAGSICLLLLFIPSIILHEIKFRNHPAYIKALEEYKKDTSNQQLRAKAEEEWRKFHTQ